MHLKDRGRDRAARLARNKSCFSGAYGSSNSAGCSGRDQMPLHATVRSVPDNRQESLPRTLSATDANVFAQFQPDGERNDTETLGGEDQRETETSDKIERSSTQTYHVDTRSPSREGPGPARTQNAISSLAVTAVATAVVSVLPATSHALPAVCGEEMDAPQCVGIWSTYRSLGTIPPMAKGRRRS